MGELYLVAILMSMWEGTYMGCLLIKPSTVRSNRFELRDRRGSFEDAKETIGDSAVAQTALLEGAVPATIKGMLDIDLLHPNATPPALQILVLLLHFSSNAAQDSLRKDAV
jgi:hypothetical protein